MGSGPSACGPPSGGLPDACERAHGTSTHTARGAFRRPHGIVTIGQETAMNDLTTTNTWLAILAIVSLIEFLMIAVAGVLAFRAYKQMMNVVETMERVHIAPLRA